MTQLTSVIPAKAGTQLLRFDLGSTGTRWAPAFAGVTKIYRAEAAE